MDSFMLHCHPREKLLSMEGMAGRIRKHIVGIGNDRLKANEVLQLLNDT